MILIFELSIYQGTIQVKFAIYLDSLNINPLNHKIPFQLLLQNSIP